MASSLGRKCQKVAARFIKSGKVLLLVRNTQRLGQPTEMVLCMPQGMSIDAVAALKAEGVLNADAPTATRFLFLPGATVAGLPIGGNMEIEYDGYVFQLLDGGTRDVLGSAIYRVFVGTRLREIA
jgi:hypothetical protein